MGKRLSPVRHWLTNSSFSLILTDSQFPIDISSVKRDHDFLERDLVEPLCRWGRLYIDTYTHRPHLLPFHCTLNTSQSTESFSRVSGYVLRLVPAALCCPLIITCLTSTLNELPILVSHSDTQALIWSPPLPSATLWSPIQRAETPRGQNKEAEGNGKGVRGCHCILPDGF